MAGSYHTNLLNVGRRYIGNLEMPLIDFTLKQTLPEKSYYASFFSLSDVFDRFQIEYATFKQKKKISIILSLLSLYLDKRNLQKDFVPVGINIKLMQKSFKSDDSN